MENTITRFNGIRKTGTLEGWQDAYHILLTMGWRRFFFTFAAFFVLFNGLFGFIYWDLPDALLGTDGSYWQAFTFSVQTFSTIGYGVFSPKSGPAHAVMVVESLLSVFVTAVLTGLVFSKFSRPTARILFSNNILVHDFDGRRVLALRVGNLRRNQIAEANVRMVALKSFVTPEGQSIRRQLDLPLVRSSSLFFAITWSVMHVIDEKSPLYNLGAEEFAAQDIEIGVSLIGYDSSFSQTIHAGCIYSPEDVVFDRYFADVLEIENGEVRAIHYECFHELKKA
jgi:inward rectifier potassium channel